MIARFLTRLWHLLLRALAGPVGATPIFVSYRREETRHVARLIAADLAAEFGRANIFFDIHKLLLGPDFRAGINRALDESALLVAIVGPRWLDVLRDRDRTGQADWVRYEVEEAFKRGTTVVPVLVDRAALPREADLPPGLQGLAYANAYEVREDQHFDPDVRALAQELRRTLAALGRAPARPAPWDQRAGRARGLVSALAAVLALAALWWWRDARPPADPDPGALGHLLYDTCWVTYDPTGMALDDRRQPAFPDEAALAADLDQIREAGFGGVVTSTSNGVMERVPRLAQERGLRVLMGVWNPADPWEVSRAIRQRRYVDAYCVGHAGYPDRYSLAQLERAVTLIKRRTGKPAAPSEFARHYNPDLAAIGDWLFPDAHLTLREADGRFRVDVDRDLELFMEATRQVVPLAQARQRPLVFANVAYPHSGIQGASRRVQAEFFRRLLDRVNDPQRGHAVKVAIVPQTAFDTPWKVGKPFYPWDPSAGLIESDAEALDRRLAAPGEWEAALSPAGRAIQEWFLHPDASRSGPAIQPRADPVPHDLVGELLGLAGVRRGDVVHELGCGDGRVVIAAVRTYHADRGVGIDPDPDRIRQAWRAAQAAGVEDRVEFRAATDPDPLDLSSATVVCLNLTPEAAERVRPVLRRTLRKGARVVSVDARLGDWGPDRERPVRDASGTEHVLYLWTVPGPPATRPEGRP